MNNINRYGMAIIIILLLTFVSASASFEVKSISTPPSIMGSTYSKQNVLEKFSTIQQSPVYSQYINELSRYRQTTGTFYTTSVITDSTTLPGYCSSCTGTGYYSAITHYTSGPTFYPNPAQTEERGYGSMMVSGASDQGGPYYLWVKPLFFATDIEEYYDMQWHSCGTLPVNFDNNILSGSYALKVTQGRTSSNAVWCGNAIVVTNQTTTVTVPYYLSGCPFGGCDC